MSLVFASICPHPPIIIPTIGSPADLKKVSKTIEAMEKLAEIFTKSAPETVIVISPHGPVDFNSFTINDSPTLAGHFYNFGDFQTELIFKNDLELVNLIEKESHEARIPLRKAKIKELDHGVLVPLYYLAQGALRNERETLRETPNESLHDPTGQAEAKFFKVIPLSYSLLDLETHFKFGKALKKVTELQDRKVAVVASGDLSHCLTPEAPGGYSPRGKEFDEKLVELLKKKDIEGVLSMDPELVEEAGECGFRAIIILWGALNGLNWHSEILSYECPFGVGYLVANFKL